MQLSKREQFLWALVIAQCLVYVATMGLIDSNKLLAYISFSSTIVSIILGLLAIIFSVFYSGKSSQSVDRLNRQLDNLSTIESQIQESSDLIEKSTDNIVTLPGEFRRLLEKFEEFKHQQKSSTERIEKRILGDDGAESANAKQQKSSGEHDEIDIDRTNLVKLFFSATSFEFDYFINSILQNKTKPDGLTTLKWRTGVNNYLAEILFKEIQDLTEKEIDDFEANSVSTLLVMLKNMDLVEVSNGRMKFVQEVMEHRELISRLADNAEDYFLNYGGEQITADEIVEDNSNEEA